MKWSILIPTHGHERYVAECDTSAYKAIMRWAASSEAEFARRLVDGFEILFDDDIGRTGAAATFNRMIAQADGELIHLLHGDDLVEPDFYDTITKLADAHPDCALYACQAVRVDAAGNRLPFDPFPHDEHRYPLYCCPFYAPSVVVRKSAYERLGGFREDLGFCTDWEMWCRAMIRGGGRFVPQELAKYRVHAATDTFRLAKTGKVMCDWVKLASVFDQYQGFDRRQFFRLALKWYAECRAQLVQDGTDVSELDKAATDLRSAMPAE